MSSRKLATFLTIAALAASGIPMPAPAVAQTTKGQVDDLSAAIKEKRDRAKEIEKLISSYRDRIKNQESMQASLENEILLFDNRIKEKELAISRIQTEIEILELEIQELEGNVRAQEIRIGKQRELIAEFIRRMRQADDVSTLDVLLTKPSLSSFFDRVEELKRLERNLGDSLEDLKSVKTALEEAKKARDARREQLVAQEHQLLEEQEHLEEERNSKETLIAQTKNSQEEYERILYELRQQQQTESNDIAALEEKLKGTLDNIDAALARGDVLMNWPLSPSRGITAHFHDRSYPFRHLFEHSGVDIRAYAGTPVRAAAGGYVAWNRVGRQYGYYTMIIHPGGFATVYAHLSKFTAKPDTYVERGEVIGLSGGAAGHPGAGLSTGPHLHFEVRQNGIPVNPENFLPDAD